MAWGRAGPGSVLCVLLLVVLNSSAQAALSAGKARQRLLQAPEDVPGTGALQDKDEPYEDFNGVTGLEDVDAVLESPAAAQVEALAEKLEASSVPQRQPVLESTLANASAEGDPSLWTAEYARAHDYSTPAPAPAVDSQNASALQAALQPQGSQAPVTAPGNTSAHTLTPILNDTAASAVIRPVEEASTADQPLPEPLPLNEPADQGRGPPAAVQTAQAPPAMLDGPMHLGMNRAKHRKKHGHPHTAEEQEEAARSAAAGQQEPVDGNMQTVSMPKDLPADMKRSEELAADSDMDSAEDMRSRTEPVNSAAVWAEHEKDYGAKLPPEVTEGKEEEQAQPAYEQQAAAGDIEYETPKRDNVVPGADFSNGTARSGERVRQMAASMGNAMKSATGTSLSSMIVVVGAVLALLAMSVYYLRYMRGGSTSSAPNIIEVGNFKGPRYSRTRRQSSDKWEGDWDNDNWDDPGTGRIKDTRHKKAAHHWDEEF